MIELLAIGLGLGLIGLGVIGMIVAGIRSLINERRDFKKIGIMLIPFVIFGVAFAISGNITEAGVATMLIMLGAMALLILLTGLRSTFNI